MKSATREWTKLYDEIRGSLGEHPASPKAQALAARWRVLIEEFTSGDPDIIAGLKAMMEDKANWPADARAASSVTEEAHQFIKKALRSGKLVETAA